jgi:hypothetical protein
VVETPPEAEAVEEGLGPPVRFRFAPEPLDDREAHQERREDVLEGRELGEEVVGLEDHADVAALVCERPLREWHEPPAAALPAADAQPLQADLAGIHRLEEEGVTDVIVGFRWPYEVGPDPEALQPKIDNLNRFAETVIAKVDG